jgi:hypothetical protein
LHLSYALDVSDEHSPSATTTTPLTAGSSNHVDRSKLAKIDANLGNLASSVESNEMNIASTTALEENQVIEGSLLQKQLAMEDEQLHEASQLYQNKIDSLSKIGKATTLKSVQTQLIDWYEPLVYEIQKEIEAVKTGIPGPDRKVLILLLF